MGPLAALVRGVRDPFIDALAGVSLRVPAGGAFGLVGESGSGKSTLARTDLRPRPGEDGEHPLRRHRADRARRSRAEAASAEHGHDVPGPRGEPEPAPDRAIARVRAVPDSRARGPGPRSRVSPAARSGRAVDRLPGPLPARAVRGPGPARGGGAGARAVAPAGGRRRADGGPGRLGPGRGAEPDEPAPARARPHATSSSPTTWP